MENGVRTMTDRGIRLTFDTQEPSEEQFGEIFGMKGKSGKLIFCSEDTVITEKDLEIPDVTPEFKGEKSPSARLRNSLYVLWSQGKKDIEFEVYYRSKMDNFISVVKDKLS